jgi:hypothetical protein
MKQGRPFGTSRTHGTTSEYAEQALPLLFGCYNRAAPPLTSKGRPKARWGPQSSTWGPFSRYACPTVPGFAQRFPSVTRCKVGLQPPASAGARSISGWPRPG